MNDSIEEIILSDGRVSEIISAGSYQKYTPNLDLWEDGPAKSNVLRIVYQDLNNFLESPFVVYADSLASIDLNTVKQQIVKANPLEADSIAQFLDNDALRPKKWFFVLTGLDTMDLLLNYIGENSVRYSSLLQSAINLAECNVDYEEIMGDKRLAYSRNLKTEVDSLLKFLAEQ